MDSIPGGGTLPKRFLIKTNDLCMICLKKCAPMNSKEDTLICRTLSRYFEINLRRLAGIRSLDQLNPPVVFFKLCEQCRARGNKFVTFYRKMEVIKLHLDEMGQEICDLINSCEKPSTLLESETMRNVRKELRTHCNKEFSSRIQVTNSLVPQAEVALRNFITDGDLLFSVDRFFSFLIVMWLAFGNHWPNQYVYTKPKVSSITVGPSPTLVPIDSASVPENDSTSNVPEKDSTANVPEKDSTSKIPKKDFTLKVPENDSNKTDTSIKRKSTYSEGIPSLKRVKPSQNYPLGNKPKVPLAPKAPGKPLQQLSLQRKDEFENQCSLCPEKFTLRGFLEKHRVTVHSILKYVKCPRCGVMVSSYQELECHRGDHPECELSQEEKKIEKQTIACPQFPFDKVIQGNLFCPEADCREVFDEQFKLDYHLKTHGTFKCGLSCTEPKKDFKKAHWLAIHEYLTHSEKVDPSKVKCPRCDLSSNTKNEYIKHFITHHLNINP